MKTILNSIAIGLVLIAFPACSQQVKKEGNPESKTAESMNTNDSATVVKTDEEWRKQLTPEEYRVLREKGTERAHTGEYDQLWDSGTYVCKACGNELFSSATKFDAGCGWPSFFKSIDSSKIITKKDYSFGMTRIEVMCARCHGHLGHVFDDGPAESGGLRYCINSVSLGFEKKK